MSKNGVDTRIVSMQFDNAKFEKNVKQTTKSLDKLNQSMAFHDADKGLEKVRLKISAMEVAATAAIANITTRVVNLGIQLVKSLSVDNIASGWAKYGDKTTSVATMIAQKIRIAGKEITDQSEKLEIVNEQLERLSWFSDETSYSFNDMVNNAGKFIATGQDLDTSVKAMEGIATWAALSGQNAATASRAMYQLAQAIGKGKIQKIDWMSIQNANMDTEEFRETILATAVSLGELTKEGENFVTKTGKKFTTSQFADFLSEGWFTSDVLVKGLDKYSAAVDKIYEISEREGLTASQVIERYGDTLDQFGVKAFKAAQEARTFTDVLNSVKDAVSSKWMTTFENIFGGQEASIKLWTDLANELYDVFAASGDFRNSILSVWGSLGGSEDLFAKSGNSQGAFWNIYDAIVALKDIIKSAWNTVFPLSTMESENDQAEEIGRTLKNITKNIQQFTVRIKNNTKILNTLSRVFKIIFNALKFGINIIRMVRYAIDPIIELVKQLAGRIFDEILYFLEKVNSDGSKLEIFFIKIHDILEDLISTIQLDKILEILFTILEAGFKLLSKFPALLNKIAPAIKMIGKALYSTIKWLLKVPSLLNDLSKKWTGKGILENIQSFFNGIISIFKSFFKKEQKVLKAGKKSLKFPGGIDTDNIDGLEDLPPGIQEILGPFIHMIPGFGKGHKLTALEEFLSGFKVFGEGLWSFIKGTTKLFSGLAAGIGKILNTIGKVFLTMGNVMTKMFSGQKLESFNEKLWGVIIVLGLTTIIIGILGYTLKNVVWAVTGLISPLTNLSDAVSTIADAKLINAYSNLIDSIVKALLTVAAAMAILAGIKYDGLWKPLIVLGVVLALMGVLMAILLKNTKVVVRGTQKWLKYTAKFSSIFKEGIQKLFKSTEVMIKKQQELNKIFALTNFIRILSNALLKVSIAMLIIQNVSWETIWQTVVLITTLVSSIILVSTLCQKGAIDVRKAQPGLLAMIGVAAVIKQLGKTIVETQDVNWSKAWPILIAITVMLSFILAILLTVVRGNGKKTAATAATIIGTLIGVVAVLKVFTKTIASLANIGLDRIAVASVSLYAFMMSFIILLALISSMKKRQIENAKTGLKAFGIMAGSLLVFALAMKALSSLDWEGFGKAITSVSIIVLLFELLLVTIGAMKKIAGGNDFAAAVISTAVSFAILTASLMQFAAAMILLSLISWENIIKGFIGIAGAIVILGVGAALLKTLIPIIVLFATSVLLIGVGLLSAGLGLQALATGLLKMSSIAGEVMANFTQAFAEMGPQFFEALGQSFGSFFTGLIEGFTQLIPAVIDMVATLLSSILDLITNFVPQIINPVIATFVQLLEELASYADRIADAVWRIILAVLKTLDDHGEDIFYHVFGILLDLINALSGRAKELVSALGDLILNILEGLVGWLDENIGKVIDIILRFIGIIVESLATNIVKLAALAAKVFLTLFAFALALAITLLGSLASLLVQFVGGLIMLILTVLQGFGHVLADGIFAFILIVIDLLVTVISKSGEILGKALVALASALISAFLRAIGSIVGAIPVIGEAIAGFFNEGADAIEKFAHDQLDVSGALQNVQDSISTASDNILKTISWTVDGIGTTLGTAVSLIDKTTEMASSTLNDAFDEFNDKGKDTGADFIAGMMDAIDDSADSLADKSGEAVDGAVDSAREAAGVHSPSVIMMEVGEYMMEGLSIGIQNGTDSVIENMSKALDSTIGLARSIISDQEEGNDITLVVGLDTSNVESQAARVNDIMSGITNPELSFYGQNADRIARSSRKTSSSDLDSSKANIDKSNNVTYNNTFNISAENAQETADEIDRKLKEQSMRAKFAKGGI